MPLSAHWLAIGDFEAPERPNRRALKSQPSPTIPENVAPFGHMRSARAGPSLNSDII
jgi:hypothetical protein